MFIAKERLGNLEIEKDIKDCFKSLGNGKLINKNTTFELTEWDDKGYYDYYNPKIGYNSNIILYKKGKNLYAFIFNEKENKLIYWLLKKI